MTMRQISEPFLLIAAITVSWHAAGNLVQAADFKEGDVVVTTAPAPIMDKTRILETAPAGTRLRVLKTTRSWVNAAYRVQKDKNKEVYYYGWINSALLQLDDGKGMILWRVKLSIVGSDNKKVRHDRPFVVVFAVYQPDSDVPTHLLRGQADKSGYVFLENVPVNMSYAVVGVEIPGAFRPADEDFLRVRLMARWFLGYSNHLTGYYSEYELLVTDDKLTLHPTCWSAFNSDHKYDQVKWFRGRFPESRWLPFISDQALKQPPGFSYGADGFPVEDTPPDSQPPPLPENWPH